MIDALRRNPASLFHAAIARWQHPASWDAIAAYDLNDFLLQRWQAAAKYKPYPRPWDAKPVSKPGLPGGAAMKLLRPHDSTE